MIDIYEYGDYKTYLNARLDSEEGGGRGSRAKLARAIGVQSAYVAQVLRGNSHFSLEQSELCNTFFSHSEDQGNFLLLLVQFQRAGIPQLKARYEQQIRAIKENRLELKNRVGVAQKLKPSDQAIYYSSWVSGAVHAVVSIPGFQSVETIAHRLSLSPKIVAEVIEFLLQTGLLKTNEKSQSLETGQARIHLPAESPFIRQHHLNWRLQAIRAIERQQKESLHYSSVVSLSEKDYGRVREMLVQFIVEAKKIIRASPEEKLASLCLDLFEA